MSKKCSCCTNSKPGWIAVNPANFYEYLCNNCYSSKYPAGQINQYVAYPRMSDAET